jgi:hypothetical protein
MTVVDGTTSVAFGDARLDLSLRDNDSDRRGIIGRGRYGGIVW